MSKFKIDRKKFVVGSLGSGRKICIEERNGRKSGKIELDLGTSTWIRDCLVAALESSHPNDF